MGPGTPQQCCTDANPVKISTGKMRSCAAPSHRHSLNNQCELEGSGVVAGQGGLKDVSGGLWLTPTIGIEATLRARAVLKCARSDLTCCYAGDGARVTDERAERPGSPAECAAWLQAGSEPGAGGHLDPDPAGQHCAG